MAALRQEDVWELPAAPVSGAGARQFDAAVYV
jgi:hypothetical protein